MPVRHIRVEALPAPAAPVGPNHLRRHRRLVNKDEASHIEASLLGLQLSARGGDIRTRLLGGVQAFF